MLLFYKKKLLLLGLNSVMVTSKSLTVKTVFPDTARSLIPSQVFSSPINCLSLNTLSYKIGC